MTFKFIHEKLTIDCITFGVMKTTSENILWNESEK